MNTSTAMTASVMHSPTATPDARTIAATSPAGIPRGRTVHDWRSAGQAWGHSAADWACLYEHYATDVVTAVFGRIAPGPGRRLLDIACGSGLVLQRARALGAETSGIDASAELIAIARTRNPDSDLRVGSMFQLPWPQHTFDTAISVNGIWGGCEEALAEAYRVLRPGALLALTFWGPGPPNDLRGCFKAYARHAPPAHFSSMKQLNDIARPGTAETMLDRCGFEVLERGQRISIVEWADADLAWRALSSTGPVVPALRHGDVRALRRDVLAALEPCRDRHGIYRIRHDHQFVIARRP